MKALITTALFTVGLFSIPLANADEWNKKTTVTFSGPVEIPGQVLAAGTYVFKLADSQSDRHIVQIFNKNENHLYATILAIPDYRLRPTGKTIISFEERAAGAPEAVKAWFYPGDNYGDTFVYPKARAVELAKQNKANVPSMPNEVAKNTPPAAMKQTPLKAQKPTGEETEITEVYAAPPQQAQTPAAASAPAPAPTETAQNQLPAQLPHTASDLPLVGFAGLLALALAFSIRIVSRRLL